VINTEQQAVEIMNVSLFMLTIIFKMTKIAVAYFFPAHALSSILFLGFIYKPHNNKMAQDQTPHQGILITCSILVCFNMKRAHILYHGCGKPQGRPGKI
jgi:hypothetical protein